MQVVILSGGLATRLKELTRTVPKSLMDLNGRPFLSHQISMLKNRGIKDLVLCTGHLGDQIEQFAGNGQEMGVVIQYSRDGKTLLGTGGAIRNALPLLQDPFFVINGDTYLPVDFAHILSCFESSCNLGMMVVFKNNNQWDTSNVVVEENMVGKYVKQGGEPDMIFIDAGVTIFRKSVFEFYGANNVFPLEDVYVKLVQRRELAAFETTQRFFEIGSVAGLNELEILSCMGAMPI